MGLPSIPRVAVAALALLVAALVLFAAPFVLHLGGGDSSGTLATPSPSASGAGRSTAPSVAPTAAVTTYIVKSGDTLLKIAKKFGVTVDQLIAANKQIKNPNKITVGAELKIPTAAPSGVIEGASPAPGSGAPGSAVP